MEKIINTETDSDTKLRYEVNNLLSTQFNIESKSDLLLKTLKTYFTEERFSQFFLLLLEIQKFH